MADTNSILNRLLSSLSIADPTWDTSVGSATYKIMESVANELATVSNNSTLQTYSFDAYGKTGTQLDAFVNLFGVTRQLGTRSTGSLTFTLPTPATINISIPLGTQVFIPGTSSSTGSNIYFSTTSPGVITAGQTQITLPASSVLTGAYNNVGTETITYIATPLIGYPSVVNYQSFTGGTDTETDVQLQTRWANTAFNNISGTVDQFIAVVNQNPNILSTNIVAAQETYNEQIPVYTVVSGNSNSQIGLIAQSQITVTSGSLLGSLQSGSIPTNVAITSGYITASTNGILPPASGIQVYYNGTSYNLSSTYNGWAGPTVSGVLYLNYSVYSPTVLSGTSTASQVGTALTSLLTTTNGITVSASTVVSGNTLASGLNIQFNQPLGYNVVISGSGSTSTNYIKSTVPDAKYIYPQGTEQIGVNLNTQNQFLLQNQIDYIYPTSNAAPLVITVTGTSNNAPYTYTGNYLQLVSEYVPTSSRITNPQTNSNFIDVFVNSNTATLVQEQVYFNPLATLTTVSGAGRLWTGNYILANGASASTVANGDYYIPFSNNPVNNFPAQVISGSYPTYVTLGSYNIPVSLDYVNYSGVLTTSGLYGTAGTSTLYTTTSISGLIPGLVVTSGSQILASGYLPFGTFITGLAPGSPSQIFLSNTLISGINSSSPQAANWCTVAYPVYDNTNNAGSILDSSAIAIDAANLANYGVPLNPLTATVGVVTHTYNSDVSQINDLLQQARTIGTNVLARQAQYLNLLVNLSVVYQPGTNIPNANINIQNAISNYFSSLSFGSTLSLSGLVSAVQQLTGIASCRITTSTDNPNNYGIQSLSLDGTKLQTYTHDVILANNQIPTLYGTNIISYGSSSF